MSPTLPRDVLLTIIKQLSVTSDKTSLLACHLTSRVLNQISTRHLFSTLGLYWPETKERHENEKRCQDIRAILLSNEYLRSCVRVLDIRIDFLGEYTEDDTGLPDILEILRGENYKNGGGVHTLKLTGYSCESESIDAADWEVLSDEFCDSLFGLISDSRKLSTGSFVKLQCLHLSHFNNVPPALVVYCPGSVKTLSLELTTFSDGAAEGEDNAEEGKDNAEGGEDNAEGVEDDSPSGEGEENEDVDQSEEEEEIIPSVSLHSFEIIGYFQAFLDAIKPDSVPSLLSNLKHLSVHSLGAGPGDIRLLWKTASDTSKTLESLEIVEELPWLRFPEGFDITRFPALQHLKLKVVVDQEPELPELKPLFSMLNVPTDSTLPLQTLSVSIDMRLVKEGDFTAVSLPHHGWDTLVAYLTSPALSRLADVDVDVLLKIHDWIEKSDPELVEMEEKVFASLSELWGGKKMAFKFVLVVKAVRLSP